MARADGKSRERREGAREGRRTAKDDGTVLPHTHPRTRDRKQKARWNESSVVQSTGSGAPRLDKKTGLPSPHVYRRGVVGVGNTMHVTLGGRGQSLELKSGIRNPAEDRRPAYSTSATKAPHRTPWCQRAAEQFREFLTQSATPLASRRTGQRAEKRRAEPRRGAGPLDHLHWINAALTNKQKKNAA